jgi:hypothetical protein
MLTFPYPRNEGPPHRHDELKNIRILLKWNKEELVTINTKLLDHTSPIVIVQGSEKFRLLWERAAWKEFEEMSAEEKRPIIERICNDEVEKVSTTLSAIVFTNRLNNLHPPASTEDR